MTIIAAAYASPTSYALAADNHSVGGGQHEVRAAHAWLAGPGLALAQHDLPAALAEMRLHVLSVTERHPPCIGLDSHYLAVGPTGIYILGSDGGIAPAGDRWAIGIGEDVGLGAMFQRLGPPAEVVRVAVEAACALREGCFGSPVVLVVPG